MMEIVIVSTVLGALGIAGAVAGLRAALTDGYGLAAARRR